jgi:hypothetical protein
MQTVHVRVNDAATGQPTPVRVRFASPGGETFAPFGRLAEFTTGRHQQVGGNVLLDTKPYAYIDGTCEVRLPAGPLVIDLAKGPEYTPQHLELSLTPGKLALRFALQRWINLRQEGWYSGDTRAHSLPPHAALLEAAAEDLAVVNLLAAECQLPGPERKTYRAIPNILAFSGQYPALEMPGHMVVVNTYNSHPVLGSLGLLNCHRPVFPLRFGGPEGLDDWTLADWCDQCHRKGGLVVWTGAGQGGRDFALGEPLANLILGKIDALEISCSEGSPFDVLPAWYALLNCGFRVPLVGGSGKDSNDIALGAMQIYARLQPGEEFTYRNWIEAIRAGRTFVTNAPLLHFTVVGHDPGAVVSLPTAKQAIRVHAEARSAVPFDRLELLASGIVVAAADASGSPASAVLEVDLPVATSGWLAARCRGAQQLIYGPAPQRLFAHTSPVYVQVEARPQRADAATVVALSADLDRMLDWVGREGRFENDHQLDHLAGIFRSAKRVLAERAAAKFET